MVRLATETLKQIDETIKQDQGASFRVWLGQVINHMDDAYQGNEFPFRSHLGASGVGKECAAAIWYSFRWVTLPNFEGRLLRLFNRGHLEEARFIAMLLMIGVEVYQQDENGKQFRVSDAGGHFGGSGDGIGIGLPDIPGRIPVLDEFKTSALKPYNDMVKNGVRKSKFEHFVQMQVYMRKMGLPEALYMVVNKNNDELYGELISLDSNVADQFITRGVELVFAKSAPVRISTSPGWYKCKFCDHRPACHLKAPVHRNCRTCENSEPLDTGEWLCKPTGALLTKEDQLKGCTHWDQLSGLIY